MKRVIIVEDDPAILEPMTIILRSAGYQVTTFQDGRLILNGDFTPPNAFLIDKQLVGMDGLDICRYLKSRDATRSIPVIMVSANPAIVALGKEAGADESLEKPFRMQELRDIVGRHVL